MALRVRVKVAGQTDIGGRKNNEDAFVMDARLGYAVVADGLGGHAAGEIASAIAVQGIEAYAKDAKQLRETLEMPTSSVLRLAYQGVHQQVCTEQRELHNDMGATAVTVVLDGHTAVIANVGDSRAYVFRRLRHESCLRQVTRDHTAWEEARAEDPDYPEELRALKSELRQTIGMRGAPAVDVLSFELSFRDIILLCSDGLTNYVSDACIAEILAAHDDLAAACQALIDEAKQNKGQDNITVVLMRVTGDLPRATRKSLDALTYKQGKRRESKRN